jgi:hypothetical protein
MADEKIEIVVDLDKITFGDLEKFDDMAAGKVSGKEMVAILDNLIVGGVRHLPLSRMPEIAAALKSAIGVAANPKN